MHPSVTRILIADGTAAFQGSAAPRRCWKRPRAHEIVTGIGLYTNGLNPRAVAAKWMAGSDSMINDVRFLGGHGTMEPGSTPEEARKVWQQITTIRTPPIPTSTGAGTASIPACGSPMVVAYFRRHLDPSTFAQAGLYVSNTSTSGRVYELSSEHHVRNEIVLHNVSNWQIYALQTEEERGEGGFALPSRFAIPATSPLPTCICIALSAAISRIRTPSSQQLEKYPFPQRPLL